jgi:hypothetical protein
MVLWLRFTFCVLFAVLAKKFNFCEKLNFFLGASFLAGRLVFAGEAFMHPQKLLPLIPHPHQTAESGVLLFQ